MYSWSKMIYLIAKLPSNSIVMQISNNLAKLSGKKLWEEIQKDRKKARIIE